MSEPSQEEQRLQVHLSRLLQQMQEAAQGGTNRQELRSWP